MRIVRVMEEAVSAIMVGGEPWLKVSNNFVCILKPTIICYSEETIYIPP